MEDLNTTNSAASFTSANKGEMIKMTNTYNGLKNRQTWNVSFWINNEEWLYIAAVEFMTQNPNAKKPYIRFIDLMGLRDVRTPDNISYSGSKLDYKALNEMMKELLD